MDGFLRRLRGLDPQIGYSEIYLLLLFPQSFEANAGI